MTAPRTAATAALSVRNELAFMSFPSVAPLRRMLMVLPPSSRRARHLDSPLRGRRRARTLARRVQRDRRGGRAPASRRAPSRAKTRRADASGGSRGRDGGGPWARRRRGRARDRRLAARGRERQRARPGRDLGAERRARPRRRRFTSGRSETCRRAARVGRVSLAGDARSRVGAAACDRRRQVVRAALPDRDERRRECPRARAGAARAAGAPGVVSGTVGPRDAARRGGGCVGVRRVRPRYRAHRSGQADPPRRRDRERRGRGHAACGGPARVDRRRIAMKITETYFMVMAADVARGANFYRKAFGLTTKYESPFWTEL